MSDEVGKSRVGRVTRTARRLRFGSLMSSLLFSTRFVTIWLATGAAARRLPDRRPRDAVVDVVEHACCPIGSVVAVVALGQMLVIMMGGIDLSMAATISLLANVLVGVSKGSDDRLAVCRSSSSSVGPS